MIETLTLHDAKRDQDLPLKIYSPASGGPFPVIVFSHGAGGSKDGYSGLGHFWVSHGYLCIHPTHADSLVLQGAAERAAGLRGVLERAQNDPEGARVEGQA